MIDSTTNLPKYAVLSSGQGTIFQSIIDAQHSGKISGDLACLISDKNFCGAKARAEKAGIPSKVFNLTDYSNQTELEKDMVNYLTFKGIEYIVLAGYLKVLSSFFINQFRDRIINTHPSLLPAFKGLDAVEQAYHYGVKITGCTVHSVTEKLDGGPILLQKAVRVNEKDTVETLREKIKAEERVLIIEALNALLENRIISENSRRWVVNDIGK